MEAAVYRIEGGKGILEREKCWWGLKANGAKRARCFGNNPHMPPTTSSFWKPYTRNGSCLVF